MPRKYDSLADRLLANSIPSEEDTYNDSRCWLWIGKLQRNRNGTENSERVR